MSEPNDPPPVPPPPPPGHPDPREPRDITWEEDTEKAAKLERVLLTIAVIVGVPIGLAVLALVGLYIACLVT